MSGSSNTSHRKRKRRWFGPTGDRPSDVVTLGFRCPDCGMTSFHPKDVEHRYCGNCHEFKP